MHSPDYSSDCFSTPLPSDCFWPAPTIIVDRLVNRLVHPPLYRLVNRVIQVALVLVFLAAAICLAAPTARATTAPTPLPTLPASGDVLIGGGVSSNGNATTQAEFYSVSSGRFVKTGAMTTARASHQAEVMFDTSESEINNDVGEIVLIGGFSGSAKRSGPSIAFNIFA